jgi:hypothetical protein
MMHGSTNLKLLQHTHSRDRLRTKGTEESHTNELDTEITQQYMVDVT